MAKAVLISIHPMWCEMIMSGQKTAEIRKTKPKLKPPFRCFVYQTQPKIFNTIFESFVAALALSVLSGIGILLLKEETK